MALTGARLAATRALPVVLTLAALGLSAPPGAALGLAQFRQLITLSDAPVADLVVDSVAWLPDGASVVVGGWTRWPTDPCVRYFPAGRLPVALDTASPRVALSPSGAEIACWVRTSANWAQLQCRPLPGGPSQPIGEPRRISPAMHLAWLDDSALITLSQEDDHCRALQVSLATGLSRVLLDIEGGQWAGLRTVPGSGPVAVWQGETCRCFVFQPGGGPPREAGPELDRNYAPGSPMATYFDNLGSLWLADPPGRRKPFRLSQDAGAAAWSPDGSVILCARRTSLAAVWPGTFEWRVVTGSALEAAGPEAPTPVGLSWAPSGGFALYWQQTADRGVLRRADLGLERVGIRVRFPGAFALRPGDRLWVAPQFLREPGTGAVIRPVWKTLKGEFQVRTVEVSAPGMVVEAESTGPQTGTLARLSAGLEPLPAATSTARVELAPRPGLEAWAQGATATGRLLAVTLDRSPLGAAQ
jgi:hypothetical protein